MPYDELKTACHKAFLMPENLAVEKMHKYWAYNTGNRTMLSSPVSMRFPCGCDAGLRCGEYWTHKDLGLSYQKQRKAKETKEVLLNMMFMMIIFSPVLFVLWCVVKTIDIMVRFISFDAKLASTKRSNPELYKQMRKEAYRISNGDKNALAMRTVRRN